MGSKYKQVGGRKSAEGLSENFIQFLNQALTGGLGTSSPAGADAVGGVRGIYGDILSGGAGKLGGSLQQILEKSQQRSVGALRSRFGQQGGMAFGTPAAYAESLYRSESDPQIATQVGELQLKALSPLIQQIGSIYGQQTPQSEMVEQKSTFGQIADFAGKAIPAAASFFAPGLSQIPAGGQLAGQDLGQLAGNAPSFNTNIGPDPRNIPANELWRY